MTERVIPCIYYTNCGADCKKGVKSATHAKTCQHCKKYRPRKTGNVVTEDKKRRMNKIRNKEFQRTKNMNCW